MIILATSCKGRKERVPDGTINYTISDFKTNRELLGEEQQTDSLFHPAAIKVIPDENLLIVLEMEGPFFGKVYTLDSLKFIRSFIEKGKGPNSQLSTSSIQYGTEEKVLYVGDIYKKKLFCYSIDSLLSSQGSAHPSEVIDFKNKEITKPITLRGNKIVDLYASYQEDSIGSLAFYDFDGKFSAKSGIYPFYEDTFKPFELLNVFISGLNTSENRDKIILNYYFTDYLDVYSSDGQLEKRIHGPDNFEPQFNSVKLGKFSANVPDKNNGRRAYAGKAIMRDKLFALYSGKLVKDSDYHAETILLYDNTLSPSTIYRLDKSIFDFDIDWSTNTIYGLSHIGENNVIKFNLN